MTALSDKRSTLRQVGDPIPARVGRGAAVDILYKGGMAAINAAGYLAPAGLAATDTVVGRFAYQVDNSGGSAGDLNAEAEQGVFRWANADSIAATDIGSPCYAADDQTVAKSDLAGARPFAGVIVDVDTDGVWVLQGMFLAASAAGSAATSASMPQLYAARGASTANVADLAAFTVSNDGVTLAAGDYVLLKNQSTASENGIYVVGTVAGGTAPLTRASFFDDATEIVPGAVVHVSEGTANADTFWFLETNETITVGTTNLTFTRNPDLALLASTANGAGASLIGIEDAGTLITATTVEGALAELAAEMGNVTKLQIAGGTFASGEMVISAGIVVTADTDAFVIMSEIITGSSNVGGIAHLKASNQVGAAGVGSVTLNILGADGAKDADAAGAARVLLIN
jgi:hypothetical protein